MKIINEHLILLDTEKNIYWDRKSKVFSNLIILDYLREGIVHIANEINSRENRINKDVEFLGLELDVGLMHNYFQWFCVSVIEYLKLIALIDISAKKGWEESDIDKKQNRIEYKKYCDDYVKEIVPDLVLWRNKVGAHFALTSPRDEDNLATLINSTTSIAYRKPFYRTNVVKLMSSSTHGQEVKLPSWSITETYSNLTKRFFPSYKLRAQSRFDNVDLLKKKLEKISKITRVNVLASKTYYDQACKEFTSGDYERASRFFYLSAIKNNKSINSFHNFALSFCNNGNYYKAKCVYDYMIENNLYNDQVLVTYSSFLINIFNDYKQSKKYLIEISSKSPFYKKSQKLLALCNCYTH